MRQAKTKTFTAYEVFIIAIMATLMFTVILDFMVISPLGVILMETLAITPTKFSIVVSAYAFSAGASGILAAGFADKFDRKKILMFFYVGFLIGTALCAMATSFEFLLAARIITGLFGGVIGSIMLAIVTDLFRMEVRGRVMGFVQMAFSASQVLGIPIGMMLANAFGWEWCFWMIVIFGTIVGIAIFVKMKPVTGHLKDAHEHNPIRHLLATVSKPRYLYGFLTMSFLASGGFMLMPFGSAFGIHNIGLTLDELPMLYLVTGLFSFAAGPLAGKLSDKLGKYKIFIAGSIAAMICVVIYTNMGFTPFWLAALISVVLFFSLTTRMIPASALMTGIPSAKDRGAFMAVNSAMTQISGGLASMIAGQIVDQTPSGKILHYDTLGYVVAASMALMIGMMYFINRDTKQAQQKHAEPTIEAAAEVEIAPAESL